MLLVEERERLLRHLDSVRAELQSMKFPREEHQRRLLTEQSRIESALSADDEEHRRRGEEPDTGWRTMPD